MRAIFLSVAIATGSLAWAAAATSRVIVAKPEVRNTVRVGDTIIFPLYDAKRGITPSGNVLREIGPHPITMHDLWRDVDYKTFRASMGASKAHYDAAATRGEAFLAIKSGMASGNILLTLPKNPERCVSCRTVHYFVTVLK